MQQAITFSGVSFAYDDIPVIEDVSIEVALGGFLLIVGPNGGGKTTFGKLMLGLLKPVCGSVHLFDRPPGQTLRQVGYVPQISTAMSGFPISVFEVVRLGLYGRTGQTRREMARSVAEALNRAGISHLAKRGFSGLSGGERQRVLIARALVSEPRLLFLDEPTANVDAQSRSGIHQVLQSLAGKTTIVLITHDPEIGTLPATDIAYINRRLTHTRGGDVAQMVRKALQQSFAQDAGSHAYEEVQNIAAARNRDFAFHA